MAWISEWGGRGEEAKKKGMYYRRKEGRKEVKKEEKGVLCDAVNDPTSQRT